MVDTKSKGGFALGDYVEVKDRLKMFYDRYPTGSIVTEQAWFSVDDDVPRIWVKALAFRTPEDPHPGVGHSWLEVPGKTPYTRGSELENAETSAWGRAIGATGIALDRSIASADEVRNKEGDADEVRPRGIPTPPPDRQELVRRADGLIGTVVKGTQPADLELRYDPEGVPFWGYKLKAGRISYQAFATGPLAEALATANAVMPIEGQTATVWGHIEMIPWRKGDRDMPPYARIVIERMSAADWTLPASDELTVPMFEEAV